MRHCEEENDFTADKKAAAYIKNILWLILIRVLQCGIARKKTALQQIKKRPHI